MSHFNCTARFWAAAAALLAVIAIVGCPPPPPAAREQPDATDTLPDEAEPGDDWTLPEPDPAILVPPEEPSPPAEEPAVAPPAVEEPTVEEPATEEPAAEEPAAEEPMTEEPAIEEPATEEPTAEDPLAEPLPADDLEAPAETPDVEEGVARVDLPVDEAPAVDPGAVPIAQPRLLVKFGEECNTPDGMALLPDKSIILSAPNFNDRSAPPVLLKITPENEVEMFYELPEHPETKRIGPMGVCYDAASGDLYLADNQLFHHEDPDEFLYGKSRLLRIEMKDGKPAGLHVVAEGFNVSNAVIIRDGYIYVSETILVPGSEPLVSGVFRFKLGEEGIQLSDPLKDDPHLIANVETKNPDVPFGADGLCFDNDGNLYIGNFADGTIHRLTFDEEGNVEKNEIFAQADFMRSADGIIFCAESQRIFVADFLGNAVRIVTLDGKVSTLAQSPDGDGADGGLQSPAEVLKRGNEIVVANFAMPVPGGVNTKAREPFTLSVIPLRDE